MIVPPTLGPLFSTKSTASFVVMCSTMTRSPGLAASSDGSRSEMKFDSRSKTSTDGSVTSPWTQSGRPYLRGVTCAVSENCAQNCARSAPELRA